MADPLPSGGAETGTPRWVKVFGLVAALLALTFVALHLTGHGFGHEHHMHHPRETPAQGGPR